MRECPVPGCQQATECAARIKLRVMQEMDTKAHTVNPSERATWRKYTKALSDELDKIWADCPNIEEII